MCCGVRAVCVCVCTCAVVMPLVLGASMVVHKFQGQQHHHSRLLVIVSVHWWTLVTASSQPSNPASLTSGWACSVFSFDWCSTQGWLHPRITHMTLNCDSQLSAAGRIPPLSIGTYVHHVQQYIRTYAVCCLMMATMFC